MNRLIQGTMLTVVIALGALALAIGLGGPSAPPAMAGVNDPFKAVDYSNMPELSHLLARDGQSLAYREYAAAAQPPRGSAVLLHGSAADSRSMHVLAQGLAAAGYAVYSLDVRGHGGSGAKGHIAYIGQLEDDLQDFMRAVRPVTPATLIGLSAGGGFALRVAGSERQTLFDHYLLLTPFISQDAPTYRSASGGWVDVGLPRYVALSLLDGFGVRSFNHLPVVSYGLNDAARAMLTPEYSFNLAQNYRPQRDYAANIRAIRQPLAVVVGSDDEMFYPDRFAEVFSEAGRRVPVTVVEGANHIGVSLDPGAIRASLASLERLAGKPAVLTTPNSGRALP